MHVEVFARESFRVRGCNFLITFPRTSLRDFWQSTAVKKIPVEPLHVFPGLKGYADGDDNSDTYSAGHCDARAYARATARPDSAT